MFSQLLTHFLKLPQLLPHFRILSQLFWRTFSTFSKLFSSFSKLFHLLANFFIRFILSLETGLEIFLLFSSLVSQTFLATNPSKENCCYASSLLRQCAK